MRCQKVTTLRGRSRPRPRWPSCFEKSGFVEKGFDVDDVVDVAGVCGDEVAFFVDEKKCWDGVDAETEADGVVPLVADRRRVVKARFFVSLIAADGMR